MKILVNEAHVLSHKGFSLHQTIGVQWAEPNKCILWRAVGSRWNLLDGTFSLTAEPCLRLVRRVCGCEIDLTNLQLTVQTVGKMAVLVFRIFWLHFFQQERVGHVIHYYLNALLSKVKTDTEVTKQ